MGHQLALKRTAFTGLATIQGYPRAKFRILIVLPPRSYLLPLCVPQFLSVLIGKRKPATLPWKGSSKSPATELKENGFLTQMLEERTLSMTKSFSMVVPTQSGNPLAPIQILEYQ